MATNENKAIARRLIDEVFNLGNLDVVDEIIAPGFKHHDPNSEEGSMGPKGFKQLLERYWRAFPDLQMELQQQIAEGDLVVDRWIARGTHQGELMGRAPTGKKVETSGITIHRITNGKIVETWNNYDGLTMLQQLGVLSTHTVQ